MNNCSVTVDQKKNKLIIEVDLNQKGAPSKSGAKVRPDGSVEPSKNNVVASSGGYQLVPGLSDGTKLSLNVIRPIAATTA